MKFSDHGFVAIGRGVACDTSFVSYVTQDTNCTVGRTERRVSYDRFANGHVRILAGGAFPASRWLVELDEPEPVRLTVACVRVSSHDQTKAASDRPTQLLTGGIIAAL